MKKYEYQTIRVKDVCIRKDKGYELHLEEELNKLGYRGYKVVGITKNRFSDIIIMEKTKE
tara:strand:+ start:147 stop:326 length:180 start_codon:yes stop_codon:yes gene_type:complete